MGKSYAVRWSAKVYDQKGVLNVALPTGMNRRKKTDALAEELRQSFHKSLQKGGSNYHLSLDARYLRHANKVEIIDEFNGKCVVAEAKMSMFEVV